MRIVIDIDDLELILNDLPEYVKDDPRIDSHEIYKKLKRKIKEQREKNKERFWERLVEAEHELMAKGIDVFKLELDIGYELMELMKKEEIDRKEYWDEILKRMEAKVEKLNE
jgi:hypothetical protein